VNQGQFGEPRAAQCFAGEHIIWWNLVASRQELIDRAKEEWKNGGFPIVVDDHDGFIPLPET
jgi:hypothetical protein